MKMTLNHIALFFSLFLIFLKLLCLQTLNSLARSRKKTMFNQQISESEKENDVFPWKLNIAQ
jgi:hypothetical protein